MEVRPFFNMMALAVLLALSSILYVAQPDTRVLAQQTPGPSVTSVPPSATPVVPSTTPSATPVVSSTTPTVPPLVNPTAPSSLTPLVVLVATPVPTPDPPFLEKYSNSGFALWRVAQAG